MYGYYGDWSEFFLFYSYSLDEKKHVPFVLRMAGILHSLAARNKIFQKQN